MGSSAQYPALRHRRKRRWGWIREMVAEHRLSAATSILFLYMAVQMPSQSRRCQCIERVSVEGAKEVAEKSSRPWDTCLGHFFRSLILN